MENKNILRSVTFLLLLLMTGIVLQAQTQPSQESQAKAEYEKQMKEKDLQMKEMDVQMKKQRMEWEMQMKKQQMEQEKKTAEMERAYAEKARSSSRASVRSSTGVRDRSFVYTSATPSDEGSYFISSYGQESQTQLTLRNSFNGETLSSDGEFNVDESTTHLRFTANGKVRHGEISIKVFYPGGKVFKDLSINSSAQITFSQSLTIKEEEKKKYVGTWKYEVKTKTAEGSYTLSIMTQ